MRRLLSGIRPDGPQHLGHYVEALRQWLSYQDEYECFFLIADVQALTTHWAQPEFLGEAVLEVVLDWLAVGLDPDRSHFVLQSQIPELAELTQYLLPFVHTEELRRNPTLREEARGLGKGHLEEGLHDVELGFLGYPVAQVADILLFAPAPRGDGDCLIVPVGSDQIPHVDFAREVARRFNGIHGPVFLEPEAKIATVARLPGTDGGARMGRSRRNTILLKEPEEEYTRKIRAMFTDPLRQRREDPGHPDGCPCFLYLQAFGWDDEDLTQRFGDCMAARTDCEDCRESLLSEVKGILEPIQQRRDRFARDPDLPRDALTQGSRHARELAGHTMERVREALRLNYPGLIRRTP